MRVRRRGFALVIVLLAVGAIFALALRSAVVSRAGAIEVAAVRERTRAEREARAAVVIALRGLLPVGDLKDPARPDENPVPAQPGFAGDGGVAAGDDSGVELPEFLKEMMPELKEVEDQAKQDEEARRSGANRVVQGATALGSKPRPTILGTLRKVGLPPEPVDVRIGDRVYTVELRDAAGLLDINSAKNDVLRRYFEAVGLSGRVVAELADQIEDWRDTDTVTRSDGAEQERYDREGITCRNGPFESIDELLFLPAMTRDIFERIKDDLCLAGTGKVHIGSASREVLAALPGMDGETVQALLAMRERGEPMTEKTLDELIPRVSRKELREAIRADPSGAVTVRVTAKDAGTGRPMVSLVGVAMVSDTGVRAIGVRAP